MLIYQNKIDPISIFPEVELELVLRRENIRIPNQKIRTATSSVASNSNSKGSGTGNSDATADEEYRKQLVEVTFRSNFIIIKILFLVFITK